MYWIKVLLTIILSSLSLAGLLGYFYIDLRGFYRERENRWWAGPLATVLPLIALSCGLLIWMIWNPLVRTDFWPLFLFCLLVSIILGKSVTSPYVLAEWWVEFGKWWQKRKTKRE